MTYTRQEIFNTVAAHLIKQRKPALSDDGFCRYRSEDGLMCAAGCLIPNHEYDPALEDLPVENLLHLVPAIKEIAEDVGMKFLRNLQTIHDRNEHESDLPIQPKASSRVEEMTPKTWRVEWKHDMFRFAEHFELDASVLS